MASLVLGGLNTRVLNTKCECTLTLSYQLFHVYVSPKMPLRFSFNTDLTSDIDIVSSFGWWFIKDPIYYG
jgi:hypothetical protein